MDYEPQMMATHDDTTDAMGNAFMGFLQDLARALQEHGKLLTIDVGGCPQFNDFQCTAARAIGGLAQANCMHSFGSRTGCAWSQASSMCASSSSLPASTATCLKEKKSAGLIRLPPYSGVV